MKKILLLAALLLSVVSCYDDSKLWESIEDHELRISELEKLCTEMNTNIASLKTIVTALQNNDYVTGVTPIIENGKEVGYTIEFAKSESITIYHGKDGADGQDGAPGTNGQDGSTPVIGVRQDSDGRYYWTLNGEWLLDEAGKKIPTTGADGADGALGADGAPGQDGADGKDGITPQLKIEDKYWYISYDNGDTWHQLGKATGEDGAHGADGAPGQPGADGQNGADGNDGDSFFRSITQDDEFVHFTLADGTLISIPKRISLSVVFDAEDLVVMGANATRDIRYTVISVLPNVKVEVLSSSDIKAKAIPNGADSMTGVIRVKTGSEIDEYSKVVVLVSNGEKVIMKTLTFEEEAIEVLDDARVVGPAEGGIIELLYLSNVECEAIIPEEAKDWISVAPSTRAMETHTVTLKLEPNKGYYRSTTITVQSPDGSLKLEYIVEQDGDLGVEIDPTAIPDNEISNDDIVWGLSENAFDKEIISNTYSGGKGVIKLSGELKIVKSLAFDNPFNLKYLILPNKVESIEDQAFVGGELDSLYIPSNLKYITGYAFAGSEVGHFVGDSRVQGNGKFLVVGDTLKVASTIKESELTIPGSIRVIGSHALWMNNPDITKIVIEEGVEVIEPYAFSGCKSLEYVYLPNSLDDLQNSVFDYCDKICLFHGPAKYVSNDGKTTYRYVPYFGGANTAYLKFISNIAKANLTNYTIEDDIDGVDPESFCRAYSLQNLTINSKTIYFSGDTFDECYNLERIMGQGATIDGRGYVGSGSFGMECSLENAKLLVFAGKGISEYEVGDYCREIGSGVFAYQQDLKTIKFYDEIIRLGSNVFWGCQKLEEVTLPANLQYIGIHTFMECPNLEAVYLRSPIPPTLEQYGTNVEDIFDLVNNVGNLKIYVPENSINLYKSTFPWSRYSNYIVGYSPNYDYYVSTDYSQDGKVTTLQTATKGDGIDIILMGDAYSDRQIADGTYEADMENLYNNLFTEEPYKSFKDHFNVYYVNVVSATEGYEYGNTALDGYFGSGTLAGGNDNAVFNYALKAISAEEMDDALLIVAMNSDNYAGTCYMYYPETNADYGKGVSVSYFPKGGDAETFAQLLHHEANGHGFAKLADEYAYEDMGAVPSDYTGQIQAQQNNWGWWKNVDFTSDPEQVRWSYFLDDDRYANEGLGAYEGGLTYWSGVWRPTEDSIMRYNTGGFNAPSREAIYYRIHKLAYGDSWEYDYEDFVEYDAVNRSTSASAPEKTRRNYVESTFEPTVPPVIVGKSWKDVK